MMPLVHIDWLLLYVVVLSIIKKQGLRAACCNEDPEEGRGMTALEKAWVM